VLAVAGVPAVASVPDVSGVVVGVLAVTIYCGLFNHIDDGMTVKHSVRHRHRYCQPFPLVRHRHSVISLSPISPITEHSGIPSYA